MRISSCRNEESNINIVTSDRISEALFPMNLGLSFPYYHEVPTSSPSCIASSPSTEPTNNASVSPELLLAREAGHHAEPYTCLLAKAKITEMVL